MLREMRTGITVLLSMLFSLFILMLGVDCYYLCENVRKDTINDTKYEYMYTLKYPEESVPEGGEACFVKTLSKEQLGYNLDVTVMGMDSDNKYYDVKTHKGKSFITVSRSVVERYGVAKGDKFILIDNATSMDYAFTVEDSATSVADLWCSWILTVCVSFSVRAALTTTVCFQTRNLTLTRADFTAQQQNRISSVQRQFSRTL